MTVTLTALPYIATAVVTARNVLLNPAAGASVSGVPSNMALVAGPGGAGTIDVTDPADGANPPPRGVPATRLVRVTQTTAPSSGGTTAFVFGQQGQVAPGEQHKGSVWVRTNEARSMVAGIEWQNASNVAVGYTAGVPVLCAAGAAQWYRLDVAGAAPATATRANLQVATVTSMAVGDRFRFCAPTLGPQVLDGMYFEVGQRVAVGSLAAWSGTPHASFSTVTTKTPFPDLATIATPTLVLDMPEQRENKTVMHDVLGRTDPVPAFRPVGPRTGTLSLFAEDYETAAELRDVHTAGRLVMLRDSDAPSRDMYYVPVRVGNAVASQDKRRWQVDVDYAEVYATTELW